MFLDIFMFTYIHVFSNFNLYWSNAFKKRLFSKLNNYSYMKQTNVHVFLLVVKLSAVIIAN